MNGSTSRILIPRYALEPWHVISFSSKYFYDAFMCGTNRVLISNHQSFSGFFKYDIEEGQMSVDYYIINDPETVAHGITLKSAMAGFFYQTEDDAIETQNRLKEDLSIAHTAKKLDPLLNARPKSLRDSSRRSFNTMTEEADKVNVYEIQDKMYGNTYCRLISDSAKCYPSLSVQLPHTVFVKLYYYSSLL